jgi:endonuclease/exonuclease/phosphatase family metal-dependent hydrolase
MRNPRLLRTLEAAAVLLFLLQAVRVLFSVLFGLIYDVVFSGTAAFVNLILVLICILAALLLPLAVPRRGPRTALLTAALLVALARIPLTINQPTVRLWSGIVLVAAAGVYATALLRERPRVFLVALVLALAADQFLRAAGNTYDVSLRAWWLPLQVALSLATGVVAWLAARAPAEEASAGEGIGIWGGLAVGALLFLETSLLGFPNALARWSGVDYALVAPLLMAATLAPLALGFYEGRDRFGGVMDALLLLIVTGIALALGGRGRGVVVALIRLVAQFLIVSAFFCVVGARRRDRTGLALALGMVLFLLLNFALAFAFTYPYTLSFFREKGVCAFVLAAVFICIPVLFYRPAQAESAVPKRTLWPWPAAAGVVLLTGVLAWPPRFTPRESAGPVRVGTYNIHYGYDAGWRLSLEEQARTIEESGADIMLLQEVDTCRITSYGVDDALWLARRLGMQEVYAPTLEGLSGIALLTRFPVAASDMRLLTSELEQTAIVHARVTVGDQPLDAYGVWLGLEPEERARQLDDVLPFIGDASPAVLGGDLNSTPDSPIYARIQAAGFADPFVVGGFDPAPTDPAVEPRRRIDYVWMRGVEVQDARVLNSLASDHRMVVVELALP